MTADRSSPADHATLPPGPGGAELLRSVGLMADGPVVWGRPVPARRSGVFVVELAAPLATAPLELTRVGKWLESRPDLRLDGERPTSRALAARLAAFWLASARVLYVGATDHSIGGRIEAMERTVLGERRPWSGGHWLHTLIGLERARLWWTPTDAVEESEDALLSAFAATISDAEREQLHDSSVILPFANLRTTTGERKATGLTGSIAAPEPVVPTPARRVVDVPPGAADGVGEGRIGRAGPNVRRAPRPRRAPVARLDSAGPAAASTGSRRPERETTWLSPDGLTRLRAELVELVELRRPEVIGRIKAAKELGDLKENADYSSAREEQSFLEGRIAAIEATLRDATVIEAPSGVTADRVTVGSRVTVQLPDGEPTVYEIVGSTEADPTAGRISNASPVGRALIGRSVGDAVAVTTPRGRVEYRILDLA